MLSVSSGLESLRVKHCGIAIRFLPKYQTFEGVAK